MKLIIQIPAFNEEDSLPIAMAELPRKVKGFSKVEWLIINDGSSDATTEVAWRCGADHVVTLPANRGLARAFMAGLAESLKQGADVIVNTDADNQYKASYIADIVEPILLQKADMVVGERPIMEIGHFSPIKKLLQKLGSFMVRKFSRTIVADAPSGFRAYSRKSALAMNVHSNYTYTIETLIQAGHRGLTVLNVPIDVNGELRPSRLFKSIRQYVMRSMVTMFRIVLIYRPFQFFAFIGGLIALPGLFWIGRFTWYFFNGEGERHLHSLVVACTFVLAGFITLLFALIAELFATNRKILEDIQVMQRTEKYSQTTKTKKSRPLKK